MYSSNAGVQITNKHGPGLPSEMTQSLASNSSSDISFSRWPFELDLTQAEPHSSGGQTRGIVVNPTELVSPHLPSHPRSQGIHHRHQKANIPHPSRQLVEPKSPTRCIQEEDQQELGPETYTQRLWKKRCKTQSGISALKKESNPPIPGKGKNKSAGLPLGADLGSHPCKAIAVS